MKFSIKLLGKTLSPCMRQAGYSPEKPMAFHRFLRGDRYPKFHIYATLSPDEKTALLSLHLDQKRPSYKGTHAHSAEHDGPLVEQEAARIKAVSAA